jgi:hypothetical protein
MKRYWGLLYSFIISTELTFTTFIEFIRLRGLMM